MSNGLRAGQSLNAHAMEDIRRRMMLDFCKWDPQVGDISTLATFPLILHASEWSRLSRLAEAASAELQSAEEELIDRLDLHPELGIPRKIRKVLMDGPQGKRSAIAARVMRFDFHPTAQGWRVSEVNSDVPGGFTEASSFPKLMALHCCARIAGDPGDAWAASIAKACAGEVVALLSAPGYLEDTQVLQYLAMRLAERGVEARLAKPEQIRFTEGIAMLCGVTVGAVVRFFQAEWFANLPRACRWQPMFFESQTPIGNPLTTILTESKRLPLAWGKLKTAMPTWRAILPETRDPRDAPWRTDESWLLKTAYCNTGDTVCMRELMQPRDWRRTARSVRWHSNQWVAQRRFQSEAVDSPAGPIYPCIGVYTINGKSAGIYGRYSRKPLIDFAAVDAAVLIGSEGDR